MGLLQKYFKNTDVKQVLSWSFYDFANSSYALIIVSFVFPIYYRQVVAGEKMGDFYYGLVISISILLGALASPLIGAMADEDKRKRKKFVWLVSISVVGTAALFFSGSHTLLLTSIIFVITNLTYEIAQTIYDSYLTHISTRETFGRISGFAWGLGYIGGVAALILFKPFYGPGFEGRELLYKLSFPLTALFFLLFSLPAFYYLKDQATNVSSPIWKTTKLGFSRVFNTITNIKKHKNIAWFLLAFYLFNDAIVTLFTFLPIFAKITLKMSMGRIAIILLVVQLLAFPFSAFFGWLSDKKGAKPILLFTIIAAFIGAMVMGGSQAIARSWLAKIVPEDKRTEFFGFNGFASKLAATTGPIIFGAMSSFTGNQRYGMLAMLPFFFFSFLIFINIKEEEQFNL